MIIKKYKKVIVGFALGLLSGLALLHAESGRYDSLIPTKVSETLNSLKLNTEKIFKNTSSNTITNTTAVEGVVISGKVYYDYDGGFIDGTPTNLNNTLYANIISAGVVIATVPVNANGVYNYDHGSNLVGAKVQISTTQGSMYAPMPAGTLPASYYYMAEGKTIVTDGTIDGVVDFGDLNVSNVAYANFAISGDSDGDGLNDINDQDDDNDGILDTVECSTNYHVADFSATSITSTTDNGGITNVASNIKLGDVTVTLTEVALVGVQPAQSMTRVNLNLSNNTVYQRPLSASQGALKSTIRTTAGNNNLVNYTIQFDKPVKDFYLYIDNWDFARTYFTTAGLQEQLISGGTELRYNNIDRTLYDANPNNHSVVTRDGYGIVKITSVDGSPFTSITYYKQRDPNMSSTTSSDNDGNSFTFAIDKPCDYDGDGVPNTVDLDSDNDGCVDAIEGGNNILLSNLVTAGGSLSVGAGSSAQNQNLANSVAGVNANGVPTIVGTGQSAGSAYDATVSTCFGVGGLDITGRVYLDYNGGFIDGTPTNFNNTLYANIISGNTVVASVPVNANGVFQYGTIAVITDAKIQISTVAGVVGSAMPASILPANHIYAADGKTVQPEAGTADGIVELGNLTLNNRYFGNFSVSTDSDGDGVFDYFDLDTDNDGILDTVECGSDLNFPDFSGITNNLGNPLNKTISNIKWGSVTGSINKVSTIGDPAFNTTIANTLTSDFYNSTNHYPSPLPSIGIFRDNVDLRGTSTLTITLDKPVISIYMYISGLDYAITEFTSPNLQEQLIKNASELVYDYNSRKLHDINPNNTWVAGRDGEAVIKVTSKDGTPFTTMTFKKYKNPIANDNLTTDGNSFSIAITERCDADGDGVPNILDLDSDNDGCLDTMEGGDNVANADLVVAYAGLSTGPGSSAPNQNLANTPAGVNANGVPNIVNDVNHVNTDNAVGQSAGGIFDPTINGCFCYIPSKTDGLILNTNTGISALGRGVENEDNWPMVRNGAWIALESKTKGFVPNRLTAAEIALIPPTELVSGMMIYNKTLNCLQIYIDGTVTGWYCLDQQTCPQ